MKVRSGAIGALGLLLAVGGTMWSAPPAPAEGRSLIITISPEDNSGSTFGFTPATLHATTEDVIQFANRTSVTHDVQFDEGFGRGPIGPNEKSAGFSVLPGRHPYHCTIHPYMTGEVVGTEATTTTSKATTPTSRTSTSTGAVTTSTKPRFSTGGGALPEVGATTTTAVAGDTTTTAALALRTSSGGGTSAGLIALIAIGAAVVVGLGGFALYRAGARRART